MAIALLLSGSVAFLSWAARPSGSGSGSAAVPLVEEASPRPAPAGEGAAAESAPTTAPAAPQRRPIARAPEDLMPPPRRHALISFRRELIAGLAELQARVARCAPAAGRSRTSFMLTVESVASGVRIVEAQPEPSGTASDGEVACARKALLGHVIPAPSAEPGRRWQLRFAPRSI